jgi:hypothetical protein
MATVKGKGKTTHLFLSSLFRWIRDPGWRKNPDPR